MKICFELYTKHYFYLMSQLIYLKLFSTIILKVTQLQTNPKDKRLIQIIVL